VCTGVAAVSGWSLGIASMAVTLLLIAIGRILGGPVGIMTVVATVGCAPFVDAAMTLLPEPTGAAAVRYYALSAITLGTDTAAGRPGRGGDRSVGGRVSLHSARLPPVLWVSIGEWRDRHTTWT
jgi:hypothetical protein